MSTTPSTAIFNLPDLEARGALPASGGGGGAFIEQGGQALGEDMLIGTTDAHGVIFVVDGNQMVVCGESGSFTVNAPAGVDLVTNGELILSGAIIGMNTPSGCFLGLDDSGTVDIEAPEILMRALSVRIGPMEEGTPAPLRLYNGDETYFFGFVAPAALPADLTVTLPVANPTTAVAGKTLAVSPDGSSTWSNGIVSGVANLTNGVSPAISVPNLSATSRIFVQCGLAVPGAGNLTVGYRPLPADKIFGGSGSFKITACLNTGAINALDQTQNLVWMVLDA